MLFYSQSKGEFSDETGVLISGAYSGGGDPVLTPGYQNEPAMQSVIGLGPIPVGVYTISPLHTIQHLGPAMCLTPAPENSMFGRSGFFIHLANPAHAQASSDGCVIAPSFRDLVRLDTMRSGGQDQLTVVA